jgi:hypothetical protein
MASNRKGLKKQTTEKIDGSIEEGDENEADCAACGRTVAKEHRALKCDGCGLWHHIECEKIKEEVYTFLEKFPDETSLHWYCKKCATLFEKLFSTVARLDEGQDRLEEKVDAVLRIDEAQSWPEKRWMI